MSTNRQAALEELKRSQAKAKRNRNLAFGGVVVAVVVVLAVLVAVGLGHDKKSAVTTAADGQVTTLVSSVPAATFDAAGAGSDGVVPPSPISAPPLTDGSKPRVLYVGAEFCPYCAAERWAVVAALSRFGSFSGLGQTASSASDVHPNTPTLSFHGATYTSDYLSFTGIETTDTERKPLDTLAGEDEKIFDTYDGPPYTQGGKGSIPFMDIGGSYVVSGSSFDPDLLKGMTHLEVAQAMGDASTPVGAAVDGSANYLTAALCQLTGGKPGAVCTSKGVTAAASALPAS